MHILEVLGFLLCFVCGVVFTSCPGGQFPSSTPGQCCKLCPAGSFMSKECVISSSDTQCMHCPANTYTSTPNNLVSCNPCKTECKDQKVIVGVCTATSNIQCECPPGRFWDMQLLRCTQCTACSKGQKFASPCSKYQDAICEYCKKGTYLNAVNECVSCDHCKKGKTVVEECAAWQNTRCKTVFCQSVQPCPSASTSMPTTRTKTEGPELSTNSQLKRVEINPTPSCAPERDSGLIWVLVSIIVGLALFVIILLIVNVKGRVQKVKKTVGDAHWGRIVRKDTVATVGSTEVIKENNIKFDSTSADVTERLALYLNANNGKNWKHLAGLMEYTSHYTQNWELTPTEATQKLLQDWQQGSGATVFALYTFLKQLHRDDAVSVLLPLLSGQASEGETV